MDRRTILKRAGTVATVLAGAGGTTAAASQQQQASVRILGTNEPVHGGQWLSVDARITNHGFGRLNDTARFVVGNDPTTVDSQSVTLSSNASRTTTLGYRTYSVQQTDIFPVRVRCAGGFDSRQVRVAPAP